MELPFLLLLWGLSDPRIAKPKSLAVWSCLGVDPLDMPRTPYRENAINNPGDHAQSPSHHHLYIIPLII